MYSELRSYASGTKKVLAIIRSDKGQVSIEDKGGLPDSYRDMIMRSRERVKGNDEAFLRQLEVDFSGSYVNASFFSQG